MEFLIRNANNLNDFDAIASLWSKNLPYDIFSLLGKKFIKEVYMYEFIKSNDAIALVAIKEDVIIGFILLCDSSLLTKKIFLEHKYTIVVRWICIFLRSPSLMLKSTVSILLFLFLNYFKKRSALRMN